MITKNMNGIAWMAGMVSLLAILGCATRHPVPLELQEKVLSFLEDGRTPKEEVLLKLGEPSGQQFEREKILTYRMTLTEGEGLITTRPAGLWASGTGCSLHQPGGCSAGRGP